MPASTQPRCSLCPGLGVLLGQLGQLRWFRCRACGMDFNRPSHARRTAIQSTQPQGGTHE